MPRQAGATKDERITNEMIAAGEAAMMGWHSEDWYAETCAIVCAVYDAMRGQSAEGRVFPVDLGVN